MHAVVPLGSLAVLLLLGQQGALDVPEDRESLTACQECARAVTPEAAWTPPEGHRNVAPLGYPGGCNTEDPPACAAPGLSSHWTFFGLRSNPPELRVAMSADGGCWFLGGDAGELLGENAAAMAKELTFENWSRAQRAGGGLPDPTCEAPERVADVVVFLLAEPQTHILRKGDEPFVHGVPGGRPATRSEREVARREAGAPRGVAVGDARLVEFATWSAVGGRIHRHRVLAWSDGTLRHDAELIAEEVGQWTINILQ